MFTWLSKFWKKAVVASGLQPTHEKLKEQQLEQRLNELLSLQRAKSDEEQRLQKIRSELGDKDEELKSIIQEKHALQQHLIERQLEMNDMYSSTMKTQTEDDVNNSGTYLIYYLS